MKELGEQHRSFLSRREFFVFAGVGGAIWLMNGKRAIAQAASDIPQSLCIVRPEQTEGPYFVDERLHRTDIRSDLVDGRITAGTPLAVTFQVKCFNAGGCQPLRNAQVDIWHCDAAGVYSGVRDPGFSTVGQKFLRGYQMTDAQGAARFLTIYPGWYPIRTVHIHFKIRTALTASRSLEFTSQLYFPDKVTDHVHTGDPYAAMGPRRVRNHQDVIFRHGGDQLMLEPAATNAGYSATFPIGLEFL